MYSRKSRGGLVCFLGVSPDASESSCSSHSIPRWTAVVVVKESDTSIVRGFHGRRHGDCSRSIYLEASHGVPWVPVRFPMINPTVSRAISRENSLGIPWDLSWEISLHGNSHGIPYFLVGSRARPGDPVGSQGSPQGSHGTPWEHVASLGFSSKARGIPRNILASREISRGTSHEPPWGPTVNHIGFAMGSHETSRLP